MAYVIQLSLKELLSAIEANLKNDIEEMDWSEDEDKDQKEIVRTLNKVRYIHYTLLLVY